MMRLDRLKQLFLWVSVSVLSAGLGLPHVSMAGGGQSAHYVISGVAVEKHGNTFELIVSGQTPPAYTMYELVDPLRIVLDVADARFGEQVGPPAGLPLGPVGEVKHTAMAGQSPAVARIEIVLVDEPAYTVVRQGNDIVVKFTQTSGEPARVAGSPEALPKHLPVPAMEGAASRLTEIVVDTANPQETLVYLKTNGPVAAFQKAHLAKGAGNPARMYIDIPKVKLQGPVLRKTANTSLSGIRAAQRDKGVRVVFDSALAGVFPYEIEPQDDGLLIRIAEPAGVAAPLLAELAKTEPPPVQQQRVSPVTVAAPPQPRPVLPTVSAAPVEAIVPKFASAAPKQKSKPVAAAAPKAPVASPAKTAEAGTEPKDTLGFAGFAKQRITVDFFKIDLHNVFRLFGEISGQNIVVDEGVNGTLTLALHDVPWDFALNIILNLKELQKEARHNTIVISQKSKQFQWPKEAADSISFKADGATEKPREALSVKQRIETPKEVLEAKKLIKQAQQAEKAGQYEEAAALYEKAAGFWPENVELSGRLASLCLARLGMHAKAVHYAKAVLARDPGNTDAALWAAIGSANMKDTVAAKHYFDLAIGAAKPASEALLSYAAFAEEQQSYNGALALLAKHGELYGDTMDTLVAKARLLDMQGDGARAVVAYNAVLASGYEIPADLQQFIRGRVARGN